MSRTDRVELPCPDANRAAPSPARIVRALYAGVSGYVTDLTGPDGRKLRRAKALVYGELTAIGVRQLIGATGLHGRDRFYDLGSGTGRLLLHVALAVPGIRCTGIEIDRERYLHARAACDRALGKGLIEPGQCEFRQDDLRRAELCGGSVYFANSTCFPQRLLNLLCRRIAALPGRPRLATLSRPSPGVERLFETISSGNCQTSWSKCVELTVYRPRAEG